MPPGPIPPHLSLRRSPIPASRRLWLRTIGGRLQQLPTANVNKWQRPGVTLGPSLGGQEPPIFSYSVLEPTLAISTGFTPFSRFNPNLHIIIHMEMCVGEKRIPTFAMIDSGCSENVIDSRFASLFDPLALTRKTHPLRLTMADGESSTGGMVTHELMASISIGPHQESLSFDITKLQSYPVMLGIPWLKKHDPWIQWSQHRITFNSHFCLEHCNIKKPSTIHALPEYPYTKTTPPRTPQSPSNPSPENQQKKPLELRSCLKGERLETSRLGEDRDVSGRQDAVVQRSDKDDHGMKLEPPSKLTRVVRQVVSRNPSPL